MNRKKWLKAISSVAVAWVMISQSEAKQMLIGVPSEAQLFDLISHPDSWSNSRTFVSGLIVANSFFKAKSDDELRGFFSQMRSQGLTLQLEVGVLKEWSDNADRSFKLNSGAWAHLVSLGAPLTSIAMDEPLSSSRNTLHQNDVVAVEQTSKFIQSVRSSFPSLKIGDIEPYPSLLEKEHEHWVEDLNDSVHQAGFAGLDFYRVDPDWVAITVRRDVNWADVKALENFVRDRHIPFSLIYWAANYPSMKRKQLASDETWFTGVMSEAYAYTTVNGRPDEIVVESWVNAPTVAIPDSNLLSFTGVIRALGSKFGQTIER